MTQNLLILLSDEHNKRMLGVSGHSHVKTPNLDNLANEGVLFQNAYCNSPICVPSRAILATGRYNAEIGYWDNADPYDGKYQAGDIVQLKAIVMRFQLVNYTF